MTRPIAVFHEHPHWFQPLFAEFDRRGTAYVRIEAAKHRFEVNGTRPNYALLFNRMSPSAYRRGHGQGIFYALNYLAHLEQSGVRVVNGSRAFQIEISKAQQASLLERLALRHPRTRVINHAAEAIAAAEGLRFPVILKPNVGGSGAGIRRFNSTEEIKQGIAGEQIDLGLDNVALVQEFIPARDGRITRVEVLGGQYLYAINVYLTGETFDLCPGDICQTRDGAELERTICPADAPRTGLSVEATTPPREVINEVERIMQAAGIEVGGVEYLIDDRDGERVYYDINALSNFVAGGEQVVGFNPYARLADFLEQEARR